MKVTHHKQSKALFALLALAAGAALAPNAARADLLFYTDPGAFSSMLSAQGLNPDENILFNQSGLIAEGLVVQGITNQTSVVVNFTGTEVLTTPAGGQARIEAKVGGYNYLNISLADGCLFRSLQLNPNNVHGLGGTIMLSTVEVNGDTGSVSADFVNGQNFLGVIAINGQMLSSATVTSSLPSAIQDISQIRIGGVECEVIPEPGTYVLMASGLLPLAGTVLRRRKA